MANLWLWRTLGRGTGNEGLPRLRWAAVARLAGDKKTQGVDIGGRSIRGFGFQPTYAIEVSRDYRRGRRRANNAVSNDPYSVHPFAEPADHKRWVGT